MRKIETMSTPQLVKTIRRMTKEMAILKLKRGGALTEKQQQLYLKAQAEARKRKLTIHHPEFLDEQ